MPGKRMKRIRRVLIELGLVYLAWCLVLFFMQGRMLYLPNMAGPPLPDSLIPAGVERLWVEREPGVRVEGWLFRPRNTSNSGASALVVLTHGNAELIDHCVDDSEHWRSRGYAVLLPEYRGYGRSGGTPTQTGIVGDVMALIEEAHKHAGIDPSRTILHGRSLGTGVAAQTAAALKPPPVAIVLESPFTSVASFSWRYGAPPLLVTNPYRTDHVLPGLACPILILHSRNDEIVPFSHGQRLAALNPRATLVELDGTHNAALSSQQRYWDAIDTMLAGMER